MNYTTKVFIVQIPQHFQANNHFSYELGYLNSYQRRPSGVDFFDRDIIRLRVFHRLNWKNKSKKNPEEIRDYSYGAWRGCELRNKLFSVRDKISCET